VGLRTLTKSRNREETDLLSIVLTCIGGAPSRGIEEVATSPAGRISLNIVQTADAVSKIANLLICSKSHGLLLPLPRLKRSRCRCADVRSVVKRGGAVSPSDFRSRGSVWVDKNTAEPCS
jgi:hypothetical protein